MKNKIKILALIFTISLTGILIFNSCKKPQEGVELILNTDFTEATISFQFINASTGEQIGFENTAEDLSITLEGEDKNLIIDNSGLSSFEPVNGFLTLALASGESPSSSNEYKFHLVANAPGYLSTSVPVTINKKGNQNIVVSMVELNDLPEGVEKTINSTVKTDINSATTTETQITVLNKATSNSPEDLTTTVKIPAGTIMKDKDSIPVGQGTITTTLVHFNPNDESSLQSFPGGFNARTENEEVIFKTAGFVAMEMKLGNKEIKNFSAPINMTVEIPAGTENTDGVKISDGMVVPIWSYETSTGKWKKESEPMIKWNTATNKYEVSFDMEHLSYWNLDWHYPGGCKLGAKIKVVSNLTEDAYYITKLKYSNGQYFSSMGYQNMKNGNEIQLYNAFNNSKPMKVEVYKIDGCNFWKQTKVTETVITNLCSGTYTLNLNESKTVSPINVKVNGVCAGKNKIYRPRLSIYAYEKGTCGASWIFVGEMINGNLSTTKLEKGKTYYFGAYWGKNWIVSPQAFTINQSSYNYTQQIPSNICSKLK